MPVYSAAQQHGTGADGGQAGNGGSHHQAAVHVPPARAGLGEACPVFAVSGHAGSQQRISSLNFARNGDAPSRTTWCWPQDAANEQSVADAGAPVISRTHLAGEVASSSPSAQALNDQVSRTRQCCGTMRHRPRCNICFSCSKYDLTLMPLQTLQLEKGARCLTPASCPPGVYTHCLTRSARAQVLLQKAQLDEEAAELERQNQLLKRAVEAATAGMQVKRGRAELSLRVIFLPCYRTVFAARYCAC